MLKDCMNLLKVQMLRSFNINELMHSKDKTKKRNALLILFSLFIIGIYLIGYICIMSYGLCSIGVPQFVPGYMLAFTSLLTLFLTIFKASSILFGARDYEQLIALPVTTRVIVASRFLSMYISSFVFTFIGMIPSSIIYAFFVPTGISFWIMILLSLFFIPLIPMTIATTLGAIVTAIASRMKHKTLFSVIASTLVTLLFISLSFRAGSMDTSILSQLSVSVSRQINTMYPLAPVYTNAVVGGNIAAFIFFIVFSFAVFAVFVSVVAWKYVSINNLLLSHATKNNFVLTEIKTASPFSALYRKEMRRYLSSSLYILNTGIGYVFMIIAAIVLLFTDIHKLEATLQIPNLEQMLLSTAPLALGIMASVMPTTLSSISLEGKHWWIALSLPVNSKTIFDSKILVNLTLSIPAILISSTLLSIALPFRAIDILLLYVTPIAYVLFSSIIGITINTKLPVFNWNSEVSVIKQGTAALVGMLVWVADSALPIILLFALNQVPGWLITGIMTIVLLILASLLYRRNNRIQLTSIQ